MPINCVLYELDQYLEGYKGTKMNQNNKKNKISV